MLQIGLTRGECKRQPNPHAAKMEVQWTDWQCATMRSFSSNACDRIRIPPQAHAITLQSVGRIDIDSPLGSPTVRTTTVRIDDHTMELLHKEAELLDCSVSEFIRSAINIRIAMILAARSVSKGADPEILIDPDEFAAALAEVARRRNRRK